MGYSVLLEDDSRVRFNARSYRTLPSRPEERTFVEFTLSHLGDEHYGGAAAYTCHTDASDVAYHLLYDGPGVCLESDPQLIPVTLVHLDDSQPLTCHFLVEVLPACDPLDSTPASEDIISSQR